MKSFQLFGNVLPNGTFGSAVQLVDAFRARRLICAVFLLQPVYSRGGQIYGGQRCPGAAAANTSSASSRTVVMTPTLRFHGPEKFFLVGRFGFN